MSPGLAERLRYLLEALDPPIHDLFEALALGATLDADVLGALLATDPAGPTDTADEPVPPMLSERELEVGRFILAGLTHKQIGARLFVSAKTSSITPA